MTALAEQADVMLVYVVKLGHSARAVTFWGITHED